MFEDELVNYKSAENFMEIVDVSLWESYYRARYNRDQLSQINHALPLHIIRSKGVEVKPDFDLKVTDLNTDKHNHKFKMFHDTGDGGITFKVDVVIKKGEAWGYGKQGQADFVYYGKKYPARARTTVWLNFWYTNKTPLYVVSDAIDVPNGTYLITNNATRKQDLDNYTVWTLEFTSFNPLNLYTWSALDSLSKWTGKTNKTASTKNTKLADCELKNFVYCREKTATTQCTRWLQEKLYQLGFLPTLLTTGWYNDEVLNAVKNFQTKYQKYYNLTPNGKMDQATLNALCSM